MQLLAGTSGYSYKEWKGPFYPEKHPDKQMLAYYAERLPTVEINNTFYRMPKPEVLTRWAEQVPEGFIFVIKASQRITHKARLKETEESLEYLWSAVQHLGPHLGPLLFQLPPYFKKDLPRLVDFMSSLPEGCRAVFEFRHESWNDEEVLEALRAAGCAVCAADQEDGVEPRIAATTDWGYLRLRRSGYEEDELRLWADRIREQPWEQAFVFFKHEDEGAAPELAKRLSSIF